jgi:sec-independent protein translocase protein TatA
MGLDNPLHIAFLLLAVLLVFGAKRLPELGRSLGSGLREFNGGLTGPADPRHLTGSPGEPDGAAPTVANGSELRHEARR